MCVLGGEGGRAQNINYKVRRKGTLLAYWTMILGSSTKLLVVKSGTCIHESYPRKILMEREKLTCPTECYPQMIQPDHLHFLKPVNRKCQPVQEHTQTISL